MSIIQGNAHTSTGGYQIERSLRFNSADSAYLSRTPSSTGNQKVWTWSAWVKKSSLGGTHHLMGSANYPSVNDGISAIYFNNDELHTYYDTSGANPYGAVGPRLYRDPAAWLHIVWAVNAASTIHYVYVNNVLVSTDTSKYPPNYSFTMNLSGYTHRIGTEAWGASNYAGLYMTEINFIDGQALTPSDFGETDAVTGIWKPKKYGGSYGTNGFYLKFADNSGTTATTLGKDSSGNGNNWTPNNFSVTAGSGNDSLVDTPTNYGSDTGAGGEVRGNYATWNPINNLTSSTNTTAVISNGNLQVTSSTSEGNGNSTAVGTMQIPSTGKWYWEVTITDRATLAASRSQIGIMKASAYYTNSADVIYNTTSNAVYAYSGDGSKAVSYGIFSAYGSAWTNGDVIGVACDWDAGTLTFYKNGTSQGTAFSSLSGADNYFPIAGYFGTFNVNFGQRPFAYTAPSGFKALCTQNLPTPAIAKGNQYFDVLLYTGTGSLTTRTGLSLATAPGLVWIKSRSYSDNHVIEDSNRGTSVVFAPATNTTNAEGSTGGGWIQNLSTTGFSTDVNTGINTNGATYVSWVWAGASNVTNTVGTITSTVSANTTAGFSVVTWTGNGGSSEQVGTGLSTTSPIAMVIVKRRSGTSDWWVGHQGIQGQNFAYRVLLNSTAANSGSGPYVLGSQSSTNGDRLYLSTEGAANTVTYVAYCFQQVAGYSAFGSYTGNGSADGPFVYTGFRPRYVLVKRTDSTGWWHIWDAARNTYNLANLVLFPNDASAEATYTAPDPVIDILSNGFKNRGNYPHVNASGGTYIYAAFAEHPFKYSLAR